MSIFHIHEDSPQKIMADALAEPHLLTWINEQIENSPDGRLHIEKDPVVSDNYSQVGEPLGLSLAQQTDRCLLDLVGEQSV